MNKRMIFGVILIIIQILITKNGIPVDAGGSGSIGEKIGYYSGVFSPTIIGIVLIFSSFKKTDDNKWKSVKV